MRKTDEEFVKDLVTAGAPRDADPEVVATAAQEIARASSRGAATEKIVEGIAKKYPQLRRPPSGRAKQGKKASPNPVVTARDIMHRSVTSVDRSVSLVSVAQIMRDLEVGSLPVHDEDTRLLGMVTDRDIVVRVIGAGLDPAQATAGEISGDVPWVTADAHIGVVLTAIVKQHQAPRRGVVVVDDDQRVIGLISERELAAYFSRDQLNHFSQIDVAAEDHYHKATGWM
ncbi:hypothetical protein GCM10010271_72540 [Streptomyces kurssanovii]|nr:hypothetical protein GCM10010271_72540 [Streptomyces kurssanovii]